MSEPLISIITINLNNASGLEASVKSVIHQTFKNFEFIIIDGASKDESLKVIDAYKIHFAYTISEKDNGIYEAMNKGIRAAKGNYLLFLNSGDCLIDEQVLMKMSPYLNDLDIISGDIKIEDKLGHIRDCSSHEQISLDFFLNISLYHQATFISKKLFYNFGFYNEGFKLVGDYEFFIRVFFKHNASYLHIPFFIAFFKEDGMSNNPDYLKINKTENDRAWLMNVSERVFQLLKEGQDFKSSTVYWLYHKTKKSSLYKYFFGFIYFVRTSIYRFLKK